jgi:purine nucleoside phosphorylase
MLAIIGGSGLTRFASLEVTQRRLVARLTASPRRR